MGRLPSRLWVKNLTNVDHAYSGPEARMFAMGGILIGDDIVAGLCLATYTLIHNFFMSAPFPKLTIPRLARL